MSRARCINRIEPFRVNGDVNVDGVAVLIFLLPKLHAAVADVLRSEPYRVFAAATRVKQEIEGQATFGSERVPLSVLSDLVRAPGVKSAGRICYAAKTKAP
jgi:hypothetical protein